LEPGPVLVNVKVEAPVPSGFTEYVPVIVPVQTLPPALKVSVPPVIFPLPSAVSLPDPATGESDGGLPSVVLGISKKPLNLVEYVPLRLASLKANGVGVAVGTAGVGVSVAIGGPAVGVELGGWPRSCAQAAVPIASNNANVAIDRILILMMLHSQIQVCLAMVGGFL